jgi:hypothetical protein
VEWKLIIKDKKFNHVNSIFIFLKLQNLSYTAELIKGHGKVLHKFIDFICNKEKRPQQRKDSIIVSIYKKSDRTEKLLQLHKEFHPTFFSQG